MTPCRSPYSPETVLSGYESCKRCVLSQLVTAFGRVDERRHYTLQRTVKESGPFQDPPAGPRSQVRGSERLQHPIPRFVQRPVGVSQHRGRGHLAKGEAHGLLSCRSCRLGPPLDACARRAQQALEHPDRRIKPTGFDSPDSGGGYLRMACQLPNRETGTDTSGT